MFNKTEKSESKKKRSEKKTTFFQKSNLKGLNYYRNFIVLLFVIFSVLTVNAAYVDTNVLFEENFKSQKALKLWKRNGGKPVFIKKGGPTGVYNAVKFQIPGSGKKWGTSQLFLSLDSGKIKGLVSFEGMVKGENLMGKKHYLGSKLMLIVKTAKKTYYPEAFRKSGSYDWNMRKAYFVIPDDTTELTLVIGIQEGKGTYYVSKLKICQVKKVSDAEASKVQKVIENKSAALIPHGDFTGTKYRGVMSGNDLSPKAFAELKKWNVNLMRYQLAEVFARRRGFKGDITTAEGYLAWIDFEIKNLDETLKLAKANGIKIIIDLHTGRGTKISKVMSNVLTSSTNLETMIAAWRKLVTHYKGNSQIYGYDLLNEPIAENFVKGQKNPWIHMAQSMTDAIRKIDPDTPIIISADIPIILTGNKKIHGKNLIYTPHYYSPHSYTYQGIYSSRSLEWSYPGEINGTYWNKDQIRVALKKVIEFQQKHHAKIYIGEFGCVVWAKGRDQYLKDCIEIFEEYGWDWTYHAFREYPGWSVEYVGDGFKKLKKSSDNPSKRVLLKAFKKNTIHNP